VIVEQHNSDAFEHVPFTGSLPSLAQDEVDLHTPEQVGFTDGEADGFTEVDGDGEAGAVAHLDPEQ